MKSIPIKTRYEAKASNYPSFAKMASDRNNTKHKLPFISVPYNIGSTTSTDRRLNTQGRLKKLHSFGCPRYFFRFNLTSAIQEEPYAYVDWCCYRATNSTLTCFEGHISRTEWTTGPSCKPNICSFVTTDDMTPSRFVMAYDDDEASYDVAFLSLDPERVGENVDPGTFTDFGDDVVDSGK